MALDRDTHGDHAAHLLHICRGPRPNTWMLHGCGSISVSTHGPGLVDSIGLLVVSLIPLAPSVLLSILTEDSLSCYWCLAMALCICFYQLLDEGYQKTVIQGSCLESEQSIINIVRGWLSPMRWVSSCASHWLAITSSSASSLSLNIL